MTAPARVASLTTRISLGVVGAVALTAVVLPELVAAWAPAILAAGILVGLPHGAVDHLVPDWVAGRRARAVRPALLAGYAATAVVALAALHLAPVTSLLVLFAVSWAHFGLGEVLFDDERSAHRERLSWRDVPAALGLGGLPIAVPLVLWSEESDRVLSAVSPQVPPVLTAGVRTGLLLVVGVAVTIAVVDALVRRRARTASEAALLVLLFVAAPPAAAFGAYFGGWHAVRHIGRLLALDPRNGDDLAAGRLRAPLRRYAAAAAVPTGIALVGIVLVVVAAQRPDWTAGALAVLLGLTVPHMAVVALLDRRAADRPRVPERARSAPGSA